VQECPDHGFSAAVNGRAAQLDGLRAIAMLAICWDHWRPATWSRLFPFEVFLFFFLVMTGYLITGSLLRERDRSEARGGRWKMKALKVYQIRRGLRILAPYYAALALAMLVSSDVRQNLLWYVLHLSNIHMAFLGEWPPGTNHFWSLSMQQQFYLVWPFVIWFCPRRLMVWAILLCAAAGPVSRVFHSEIAQWVAWPQTLTWASLDYFGIGGLMALAVHRGMSLESPGLRWICWACFAAYLALFGGHALGWQTFGLRPLQQTMLSIALCGVIAAGSVGFSGAFGKLLLHPVLQRVGHLSYGIYLYHNFAPMLAGWIFWLLWRDDAGADVWAFPRIAISAAVTWGLALASWRWIEVPLQEVRSRFGR
jgi:peptidoglycan/LPS O-acetylase OafA/YrhL